MCEWSREDCEQKPSLDLQVLTEAQTKTPPKPNQHLVRVCAPQFRRVRRPLPVITVRDRGSRGAHQAAEGKLAPQPMEMS